MHDDGHDRYDTQGKDMDQDRFLIVNADDFGRTSGVNKGIVRAHRDGVVTSASLMVRWPGSDEAATYAREQGLPVGLHLDLGEWVRSAEGWEPVYQVVPTDDAGEVAREVGNQLGRFHKIMGRTPTHIDSHQHVHLDEPVRSVVADFASRLGIPVRMHTSGIGYCGSFYGQDAEGASYTEGISFEAFVGLVDSLAPGVTELSCHPGEADEVDLGYTDERQLELAVLCDTRVAPELSRRGVTLVSFDDLRRNSAGVFELRADLRPPMAPSEDGEPSVPVGWDIRLTRAGTFDVGV
ncbi:MAG TPA: ChbG/HpnK family deacetylase [Acidimicrobiales bacterium]|nr:ChbG/HpnK family deacetylase [Acidimicrobiales bacterium]